MRAAFVRFLAISGFSLIVGVVLTGVLLTSPRLAISAASNPINGWAWSDTIGWISMSGTGYGLFMDSTGTVNGYAWSDNIGWVSANANDIGNCAPGATSRVASGMWSGWLRAVAGGGAQSGGWDGCISMSGSGYGVSFDPTTGKFGQTSKFAWGSDVVGWVDFSQVTSAPQSCTPSCTCVNNTLNCTLADCSTTSQECSYQCSQQQRACIAPPAPSGTFIATPSIVAEGSKTTITENINNVTKCTVTGSNGDGPWTKPSIGQNNNVTDSNQTSAISTATTYTMDCVALDNTHFIKTLTVNIIPAFREI